MLKLILFVGIFILTGCGRGTENGGGYLIYEETVPAIMPATAPLPLEPVLPAQSTHAPEEFAAPLSQPGFYTLSGTIVSAEGFAADGSRPHYIDWLTVNIVDGNGDKAIIAVLPDTLLFLDDGVQPEMGIRVYISETAPEIIHDPPMYVASVIAHEGVIFEDYFLDWNWPNHVAMWLNRDGVHFSGYVFPYVLDYMFPMSDFTILDLPISINGEEIESPPVLLAADGVTVMVPFREVIEHQPLSVFSYLSGGQLRFGTGDGGSWGASLWELGSLYIGGLPGSTWRKRLDVYPILVDGIIYVSLICGISGNAPITNAWLFEDRIEVYTAGGGYHGIWQSPHKFTEEEAAALPIVVNGVVIDAQPIYYSRNLMVPLLPVLAALGIEQFDNTEFFSRTINGEPHVPFLEYFRDVPRGKTNAKIYENRIIIITQP